MAKQKLYQFVILFHPRRIKKDEEDGVYKKSEIVAGPDSFLASDDNEAQIIVARKIPEKYITEGMLDCVEIGVRPF